MNLVFSFSPAQVGSAAMAGRLIVNVSTGVASESDGVTNSGFGLVTRLRQAGLPASFAGVIRFVCRMGVEPMNLSSIAKDLRAAGWSQAKYEASSAAAGPVYAGPGATAALRSLGARAMTVDGSIFANGGSSGPQDPATLAHERVHQL